MALLPIMCSLFLIMISVDAHAGGSWPSQALASGFVKAVNQMANVSAPLRLAANTAYTIQISVGQNQLLTVVVDTCASLSVFKSSSINLNDQSIQAGVSSSSSISVSSGLDYDSGTTSIYSGSAYTSSVSVGSPSASSTDCPFVVSNDPSLPYDGVLGLGLAGDSSFLNFLSQLGYNATNQKYFGVFLASSTMSPSASELTLGGFNPKRFTGPLYWYGVPSNSFSWSFSIDGVSVYTPQGPSTLSLKTSGITTGRIDTASIYIQLDTPTAALINKQIGAVFNGTKWVLPCVKKSSGPNVIFLLSNGAIPIHVLSVNYIIDANLGGGLCVSAFKGGAENFNQVSFGIPFLQAAYTVYDYSGSPYRIAFAQAVLNSVVSRSSRPDMIILYAVLLLFILF